MMQGSDSLRHDTNQMLHFKHAPWILAAVASLGASLSMAAAAAAELSQQDLAPADPTVAQVLPRYLEARAARFIDWLGDGAMLVSTRFGETEQIHRVRSPAGEREQLSFDAAGVLAAAAQPQQPDGFVYLAPRGGGQAALLLVQPGRPGVPLTDGSARDSAVIWAHDGRRIAFSSNRGAAPASEERGIELLDTSAASPTVRILVPAAGHRWRVFDWSSDDQRLLVGRESVAAQPESGGRVGSDADLFVADVASGELTAVAAPHKKEETHKAGNKLKAAPAAPLRARTARFAPDGRGILLLGRNQGASAPDFRQLEYIEPASGEARVLSNDPAREVDLFDQSADGHFLAYTTNEGGSSRLSLLDQQRRLDLNVAAMPPGIISSLKFDASGKRLSLTLESARGPRDVYVLEPATQALTRWTDSELGPLDPTQLIAPALVRYPTWDRIDGQPRMLSAYVYRPPATSAATALHPVLILLRTGAGTQYRPGFEPLAQFLARELGYVVIAPNVRGAAGYGRSFEQLGEGALRDDAARDVGSLLVWIGLQHELDFNHIAVMGEGLASYLALACLSQYGDRLHGGIVAFPPHVGPGSGITSVQRPVLLVHGRSDPDVPAYETEQLAARLRASGASVQYLGAADEGARFLRKSNRDAYYTAAANFLAQLAH
jgi:dipeptidyl aminopeptidase/acylaminoacyl peptidase